MTDRDPVDVLRLGASWPRPGWAVLDAAREQGFTGTIEFDTAPAVRVHLDRGRMYVAERVTDPSLGARLVDAGALTAAELEQGVIRLGDVEHLGRLFERVPTVDCHRVRVVLELMTDEAARWVAGQLVRGAVVTPYEHHPSGVHRWLDEVDATGASEAASPAVRRSPLPAPVPGTAHFVVPEPVDADGLGDDVRIEWADAAWLGTDRPDRTERVERRAVRAGFDGDPMATAPVLDDDVAVAFVAAAADEIVDGFEVIWPTGEVQRDFPAPVVEPDPVVEQVPLTWNIRMPLPASQPAVDLVDELAEEVALAVRRAIASITGAEPGDDLAGAVAVDVADATVTSEGPRIVRSSTLTDEEAHAARRLAEPAIEATPLIGPPPLNGQVVANAATPLAPAVAGEPWLSEPVLTGAGAPIVDERRSALRRLISGLRRR